MPENPSSSPSTAAQPAARNTVPPALSLRAKLLLIVGLVGVDRWTKILALDHVRSHPPQVFLGNFFRLEYAENPGAFLSLGANLSAETRFWVFAVAVGGFLLGASWILFRENFSLRLPARAPGQTLDLATAFSLSVIIGGGIGNLIDRATRVNHGVVDFMNMGVGSLRTGIFNVADMAIMLGVVLLAWKSFRGSTAPEPKSPAKRRSESL
jgi:signal peptidase II